MKSRTILILLLTTAFLLLSSCGPSPEEIATQTASAWTSTPVPPTSTPTPTPVPYNLTISVEDLEGNIISGADIVFPESGDNESVTTDGTGQYAWANLPVDYAFLIVDAQGYAPIEQSFTLQRGPNEISITLPLDPSELRASQACLSSETLVAMEDLEDGQGQDWGQIAEGMPPGWSLISDPEDPENMIIQIAPDAPFADASHETPNNFVIRWKGQIDGSGTGWAVTIFERRTVEQAKTQYNVFLNTTDSQIKKFHLEAGEDIALFTGQAILPDTWLQFEVSFFKGDIQVWVDGNLLMGYTDPDPFPSEGRGSNLTRWADSLTVFNMDNLIICELSEPFVSFVAPVE